MKLNTAILGAMLALGVSPAFATVNLGDSLEVEVLYPDTSTVQSRYTVTGNFTGSSLVLTPDFSTSITINANSLVFGQAAGPNTYSSASFNGYEIIDQTNANAFAGWTQQTTTPSNWTYMSEFQAGGNIFINLQGAQTDLGSVTFGAPGPIPGTGFAGLALILAAGVACKFRKAASSLD